MQVGMLRQFLLGQTAFLPKFTQALAKDDSRVGSGHRAIMETLTTMSLHTISVMPRARREKMKTTGKVAVAGTVLLTIVVLTWGQSTPNDKTTTQGRYQLIAGPTLGFDATSGQTTTEQHMFMLDTSTGKAWEYVASGPFTTPSGKPGFTGQMFVRIFIDELEETVPDHMQKTVEYFDKHPATRISPKH
jgi:hypothetical protein